MLRATWGWGFVVLRVIVWLIHGQSFLALSIDYSSNTSIVFYYMKWSQGSWTSLWNASCILRSPITAEVKLFQLFVLQSFQRLQKLTVPFVLVACPDRSLDRWVGYSWSLTCGNNGTFGCQMRTKATQADVSNPHAHCLAWVSSRSPHRQPIFRWLSINSSIAPFISTRHRLCTHKASS